MKIDPNELTLFITQNRYVLSWHVYTVGPMYSFGQLFSMFEGSGFWYNLVVFNTCNRALDCTCTKQF